jgi:hypothetical protein
MGHADPHGYYRVVGVAPHASRAAVTKLYARRAKELDAGYGGRVGAAEVRAALDDAYRVLSDPETRALYDTEDLTRAAPGTPAGDDPVACGRCRKVSAQPRYVIFHQVIGRLTHVFHDRVQGIYCPRCARDVGLGCSLLSWFIGWWGVPNGPVATVRAIWRNMRGGEVPPVPNARLLGHQARAFAARGKTELARALAARAVALDPEGPGAAGLRGIAADGEGAPPVLQDPWKSLSRAAPLHLVPGIALVAFVLVAGPFSFGGGGKAPAPDAHGTAAEALADRPPGAGVLAPGRALAGGIVLHAGPGVGFPTLAKVPRLEGAEVMGPPKDGWVPVRLGGLVGFVPLHELDASGPPGALKAWCLEHRGDRPETGAVIRRGATGDHALAARNRLSVDALVKLRDVDGATVASVYLRAGERTEVTGLPPGPFTAVYATGADWSGPCETFVSDLAVFEHAEGVLAHPAGDANPDADAPVLTLAGATGGDPAADVALFAAD